MFLGDVPMLVESGSDTILDAEVREFFAAMPPAAGNGGRPRVSTGEVAAAHGPPDEVYGPVRLWRQGDELEVAYEPVVAHCDSFSVTLGSDRSLDAAEAPRVRTALRAVLHHALAHLLGSCDRLLVHAAAVARDGAAALLTGPTGAGKSTTAYAAWKAGWSVLADDWVLIAPSAAGCRVCGLHRRPHAPAEVVPVRERGSSGPAPDDPRKRIPVALPLDAGQYALGAMARIAHAEHDETAITRLPALDAVYEILGSAPAAGHPPVARLAFDLANRVAAVPFFRIELPLSPAQRAASVARQLDLLATGAA